MIFKISLRNSTPYKSEFENLTDDERVKIFEIFQLKENKISEYKWLSPGRLEVFINASDLINLSDQFLDVIEIKPLKVLSKCELPSELKKQTDDKVNL